MKNKFFYFLSKYWLCFLLSLIMILGISFSTRFANLYESGNGMIRFDLRELYLIFGLPLYSLTYGCLSYIKVKKIWLPLLILFTMTFIYWFRFDIKALNWPGTYIWTIYPIIFSLIGASVTALIYIIIKSTKENKI